MHGREDIENRHGALDGCRRPPVPDGADISPSACHCLGCRPAQRAGKSTPCAACTVDVSKDQWRARQHVDVFATHQQLITDYAAFTSGFTHIHDARIRAHVSSRLTDGEQWPDPYLALNPSFDSGGSVDDLLAVGALHPECARIFRVGKDPKGHEGGRSIDPHTHQREAIEVAAGGGSYVLTTGTGSGKAWATSCPSSTPSCGPTPTAPTAPGSGGGTGTCCVRRGPGSTPR